jgi:hypothetical protein
MSMPLIRPFAAALAVAAILATAAPAAAVTNGIPDGGTHPYVGQFVGDFDPSHPGLEAGCAGTLISPTVFLTAAHCIAHRPERQAARLFVSLSPQWTYPGAPAASDLHPVTTYHYDPGFDQPDPTHIHDLAVLVLDPPVAGVSPARLPAASSLERLAEQAGPGGALFDSVGYGTCGIARGDGPRELQCDPYVTGLYERRVATSGLAALTPDRLVLLTEDVLGFGGACVADSGSASLSHDTNVIVALPAWGDSMCEAHVSGPRLDTPQTRSFLGAYVPLP